MVKLLPQDEIEANGNYHILKEVLRGCTRTSYLIMIFIDIWAQLISKKGQRALYKVIFFPS